MQFHCIFSDKVKYLMHSELDRDDIRILALLQEQGDLSAAEIAKAAGMTPSTCWRRITRLQELGVIRGQVTLLSREKLGLGVLVFTHVKLGAHGREAAMRFEEAVQGFAEVQGCYSMTGEMGFLLRIACRDLEAYESFLIDHLAALPGVTSISSCLVLKVIKDTTALPLGPVAAQEPIARHGPG